MFQRLNNKTFSPYKCITYASIFLLLLFVINIIGIILGIIFGIKIILFIILNACIIGGFLLLLVLSYLLIKFI